MNGADNLAGSEGWSRKAPRHPMLWAALAFSLGIVTGHFVWRPTLWWLVSVLLLAAAGAYWARHRPGAGWIVALAVFYLFGAFHIQARDAAFTFDTGIQPYADGQELQIVGHVVHDGRLQPAGPAEMRQTLELQLEQVTTPAGEAISIHSGIRLNIYSPDTRATAGEPGLARGSVEYGPRIFLYGERLRAIAKLKRARNFRNPGAFDYEEYLRERGIAALGSAKMENVEVLPGSSATYVQALRNRLHRAVIAKVHQLWPARQAALIDAMVIGEGAFIDRDTRTDFQRSGTYHVLVVSGMNVSILAFVIFWTLRRVRVGDIPATLLTLSFCIAYAFITEVGAPVWRAILMCAVYMGTRLLYRDRAMLNTLGVAAVGLLLYDPQQLFTASFQMTFVCVLIVAAVGIPILERTSQLYRRALVDWNSAAYAAQLPPRVAQFRVELQFISARVARFVGEKWSWRLIRSTTRAAFTAWELLFISAVMQMGLALPMAYYFHRATTIGLPANLIVVPLTQLMMPAAVLALGLGYISPWLAKIPAQLATIAIEGIAGSVHGLGTLRPADLRVAMPSTSMIVLAAGALVLAMWAARRRRVLALCGLAAVLAASLALAVLRPAPRLLHGVLEVTSIDVGEGDCTLIVTPQGRTLLVDAGGPIGPGSSQFDFGEDVVSPYLWSRGISRLDAVAVTHGHSDHVGGMASVIKNFRPGELWVGLLPPSNELDRVISTAQASGVKVVRHWENDQFSLGGATVTVLFPPRDWVTGDKPRNNDSMVLRIAFQDSSVLLEGDAEKQVERRIAEIHHPNANLLKVGHHGSANASTPELLNSVRPEFATISVGAGNSFGLPRTEILERLSKLGARVYRTDMDGAVTFYLDGHSVTPSVAALR